MSLYVTILSRKFLQSLSNNGEYGLRRLYMVNKS